MSNLLGGQKQTPEELEKIRQVRTEYQNNLSQEQVFVNERVTKKEMTPETGQKIFELIKQAQDWLSKNPNASVSEILANRDSHETDFRNLRDSDQIKKQFRNIINALPAVSKAAQMPPEELAGNINSAEKLLKKRKGQQVNVGEGISVIWKTAMSVFFSLLVIGLCIMAGSFAANMAIGRDPPYRVLYFLYGAIPIFAPFVLLYGIYKRLRYGPFTIYSILPVSIEPATTRLGKILWFPFYWIPDEKSIAEYDLYRKAVEAAIPT
jgi:hypothetical protein